MFILMKDLPALLLLISGVVFSIGTRRLTIAGAIAGLICGSIIYVGAGYAGLLGLTLMFGAAAAATSMGRRRKEEVERPADRRPRNAFQVIANCGMATICAAGIIVFPTYGPALMVILFSALASALSDTLSSELGTVYGRNYYHVLSWKRDARGLDGVVSLEGTLAGLAGASGIALLYALLQDLNYNLFIIILAGMMGNFFDSLLGAAFERRNLIGNDMVNFSSTLFAALSAGFIILIFSGY